MSNERANQKKLAKLKKKRIDAQAKSRSLRSNEREPTETEIMERLVDGPFGRCFAGRSEHETNATVPALVPVVLTRAMRGGRIAVITALLDRTCVGVKDGAVQSVKSVEQLKVVFDTLQDEYGAMTPCEPLFAVSMIFHAIDYARTLGFEPHEDFRVEALGPRPDTLLETPLAHPTAPVYVERSGDDVADILQTLAAHGHPHPIHIANDAKRTDRAG